MLERHTFLDVIDSFDVDYDIVWDDGDMILVFIPTPRATHPLKKEIYSDDIADALADAGAKIYDVILEDLRDGIQVGIEF